MEPLCPGVTCRYTLAQWLFAAMASALKRGDAASSARSNQLPFPLRASHGAALAPDRCVSARMQKAPVRDVAGAARAGQPATLHLHHPRGSPSARHGAARQHWWSGKLGAATALAAAYLAPNAPI